MLQDTCFSSYVSNCQMVVCLEDSHDMVDHEKCGNLNFLDVFEDELEYIKTFDVVEEELEWYLDEGYVIFKEEHDSYTLGPIYDKGFTILKELHDTTHMDPFDDETSALFDHLGELVHSPTFYNSMFCSISLNEVWVKGLFFMVPHEEYETPIFNIYDDMVGEHSYSHFQQHPLLHYDDTHLHGCTYDVHLSHLETHDFTCSLPSPFDV